MKKNLMVATYGLAIVKSKYFPNCKCCKKNSLPLRRFIKKRLLVIKYILKKLGFV